MKNITIAGKLTPSGNMEVRILSQTRRGKGFGVGNRTYFRASNNMMLQSISHMYAYEGAFFVLGARVDRDYFTAVVSITYWDRLKKAVEEYNEYFKD